MIYLFILFFCTFYFFCVEKYSSPSFLKQLIFWSPAFIIFFIFPSLQSEVGTDYSTYFQYYFNDDHELYRKKNEIIYFYIVELAKILGSPQSQFIIVSFIQALLFFYLLFLLKKEGYKIWLIFLIFFLSTGIYHNQMNGLRQYICIYAVPIMAIYIFKNKYFNFSAYSILSFFIHSSSLISSFILLSLSKIKFNKNPLWIFLIFIVSFFIYLINFKSFIIYVFELLDLRFLSYVDTKYAEGKDLLKLATRFYYLPIVLIFWVYFLKNKKSLDGDLNFFFICIFSFTYFMFLQALSFELMVRVWSYFNIFIIFPIYYVLVRSNRFSFLLIILYMLLFYVAKVLLFPVAEYEYHIYRGWF